MHGTKWARKANILPNMTKNACFGPNLVVFGPKILILWKGNKSFSTLESEKPLKHLVYIVFWSGMGLNGPKRQIFGPKYQLLPNLAENPYFWGWSIWALNLFFYFGNPILAYAS